MTGEKARIWTGLVTVSLVWGSTWLMIRVGLHSLPPLLGAGMRFAVASSILFTIVRVRSIPFHWTTQSRRLYFLMGILSFGIPFALVYWAEQYVASGLASILFAAYPFWVALFSHFVLRSEPLDVFKIGGIILCFLGIVLIFGSDINVGDLRGSWAIGALMVSPVLQAFMLTIIKKEGKAISPFSLNLAGMSIGSVLLILFSLALEDWGGLHWDASAIGSILYLAVFGSVVAFVTYYWMLKRVQAVYLSLTSFVNPIVAVVLGWLVLGETLGPYTSVGASFVLLGLLVANGREVYEKIRV
jgi:drug/metabolite transporter (DMT)-like permease